MSEEITIVELPERLAVVVEGRAPADGLSVALAECIPAAVGAVVEAGLEIQSPPFTRYLEVGEEFHIECGVLVEYEPSGELAGNAEVRRLGATRAVRAVHRGHYDTLRATYEAIEMWMAGQGLTGSEPPLEIYLNDPGEVAPDEIETEILQPVRP